MVSEWPWFWMSFADEAGFLGGAFVRAPDDEEHLRRARNWAQVRRGPGGAPVSDEDALLASALIRSHELGINPGGEAKCLGPIPRESVDERVPEADRERLLSREEIPGATRWT